MRIHDLIMPLREVLILAIQLAVRGWLLIHLTFFLRPMLRPAVWATVAQQLYEVQSPENSGFASLVSDVL
jgi:hypothetical protein